MSAPIPGPRGPRKQPLTIAADPDALLTIQTVCALVGLAPSTIRRMVKAGTFPEPMHRGPRYVRWPSRKIREYLRGITPL